MKYYKQLAVVTIWEYRRFFKPKNELLGIFIMLIISVGFYFVGKYALSDSSEKLELTLVQNIDSTLDAELSGSFNLNRIKPDEKENFLAKINQTKEGLLLAKDEMGFVFYTYKKSKSLKKIQPALDKFEKRKVMKSLEISNEEYQQLIKPAPVKEVFFYSEDSKGRKVQAYFFAALMLLAVFLSFAYQFVAITGEKQLKITEQIVSAIKPQVWMDGKILGITLTGFSSMFTYTIIGILGGMLYFQFTGVPVGKIIEFIHFPSLLLFFCFALTGILIWNALLASIASIITDPNNSGKSSLMLLPVVFVLSSFLVMRNPDNGLSIFLSWFPLTSSSAMPMRWAVTEVKLWELAGSLFLLFLTFYFLRKLAAKIFRISILISGKEPGFREIWKLAKES